MLIIEELTAPLEDVAVVIVSAALIYILVIAYIRIAGLRSMSKLSSFDFIMTVAVGAIVGSVAVGGQNLTHGIVALAVLFTLQVIVAQLRRTVGLDSVVDNDPILLMAYGEVVHDNMQLGQMTTSELHSKLREANVLNFSQVKAVVLEATGDVSVLHGDAEMDLELFTNVVGADRLREMGDRS